MPVPIKHHVIIKAECRRIGMPVSKFFMALFHQHFIKKYGIDLNTSSAEVYKEIMNLTANTYGAEYESIKPNGGNNNQNLKPHTHNLKQYENEEQPKPQYKPLAESQYAKRIHEPLEQFDERIADSE